MPLTYVCFKDYDESIPNKLVAFKKEEIDNTFGEYLAAKGLRRSSDLLRQRSMLM